MITHLGCTTNEKVGHIFQSLPVAVGNTTGNPGVSRANPYPYPSNPYPTSCG